MSARGQAVTLGWATERTFRRTANLDDRLVIVHDTRAADVAELSDGRFGPDPQSVFDDWPGFRAWAATVDSSAVARPFAPEHLGPVVTRPRQIFAIGLNYDDHASESGFRRPEVPVVFSKFASSLSGPVSTVALPSPTVDWEVELVVAIAVQARHVSASAAWDVVAGVTAGQDLSERTSQHAGPAPQFSLAKSHAGFSPIGPTLVTVDELATPDDLSLGCAVDGDTVQDCRTSRMIFPVSELIAYLSGIVTLYPGDLIFTGTPSGVGAGRTPPRYLTAGARLDSWVEGVGQLNQTFTAGAVDRADNILDTGITLRDVAEVR